MEPKKFYSINSGSGDQENTPLLGKQVGQNSVPPQWCSVRGTLAIFMFFGFAIVYGLRVNLSVAMVAMVNETFAKPSTNNSLRGECPVHFHNSSNASQNQQQPEGIPQYDWDSKTQGFLLGAFFFGYLFTQIPGGYLSDRFGGSIFMGGGILGTAALTVLTPLAAQLGIKWLFALRVLEGVGEGVTFPAMMAIWAKWAPPLERARLLNFSTAGANFGAFVAFPLTGLICNTLGWPAVFYICGGAGCLWAVFWFILVSDDPRSHRSISEQEREYIINSIDSKVGYHGYSVPLLSMLLSVPLWAIILTQMCANWSYYTLLTSLPIYMDTILHFDIQGNSILTAVPYLGAWLAAVLGATCADTLLEKNLLSITTVRKLFTAVGLFLPSVFLLSVGFVGCSSSLAVIFLTLSLTFGGLSGAGVFINQIDIAPRYAGMLQGITNTFGTIPGVVAPIAVGYFTSDHSLTGWRKVFYLSAGTGALGALIFAVLGSGKIQSWAVSAEDRESDRGEECGD